MNHEGQTALMLAAEKGMIVLLRRLLHCHASMMPVDTNGQTVLHYALKCGLAGKMICRSKVNQVSILCVLLNVKSIEQADIVNKECED